MKNESGCPSGVSNANGQRTTKASNVICGGISISLVPFGLKLARLAHSASWFALVLNPDAQYVFTNESWMTRPNPTLAGDILPDRSRATPRESGTRDQKQNSQGSTSQTRNHTLHFWFVLSHESTTFPYIHYATRPLKDKDANKPHPVAHSGFGSFVSFPTVVRINNACLKRSNP